MTSKSCFEKCKTVGGCTAFSYGPSSACHLYRGGPYNHGHCSTCSGHGQCYTMPGQFVNSYQHCKDKSKKKLILNEYCLEMYSEHFSFSRLGRIWQCLSKIFFVRICCPFSKSIFHSGISALYRDWILCQLNDLFVWLVHLPYNSYVWIKLMLLCICCAFISFLRLK